MANTKNYSGKVNVTEFHYAVLGSDDTVTGEVNRIKFLQNVNIEFSQEISRAYGDGKTAELAISNGPVSLSTTFHNIPQEYQDELFGAEVVDGVSSYGGEDTPPYVAVAFKVEHNDGGSSWLGLTKGKFMRGNEEGSTKEDSVEFGSDEVSGEFMERKINGFDKDKSYLKGYDAKGETTVKDKIFEFVFGVIEATPEG